MLCNFINPFYLETGLDELYFVSSGVSAKPEVLQAVNIGRADIEAFITDRLIQNECLVPWSYQVKLIFATSEVSKTMSNKVAQAKAERNTFAQLIILSIQNVIDWKNRVSKVTLGLWSTDQNAEKNKGPPHLFFTWWTMLSVDKPWRTDRGSSRKFFVFVTREADTRTIVHCMHITNWSLAPNS
jgi:hypothetical protein